MNEPAVKALVNALACGQNLVIQTSRVGRITAGICLKTAVLLYSRL